MKVCVIGAGCSGITAIKNLVEQGITNVVCYEQSDQIGGNWVFRESNEFSSVYETTHIISSKSLSAFQDFPMPDNYPDYPSHAQVLAYFQAYVKHFELEKYIQFNTKVQNISKTENGKWRVETAGVYPLDKGGRGDYDAVLIANGHHSVPRYPQFEGEFGGELLHSHYYKKAESFKNKRILVIGGGNSACDVAVETSRVAQSCDISMRRGQYIVPKFMMGKPIDVFNAKLSFLPKFIRRNLNQFGLQLAIGRYKEYGLQTPNYPLLKSHPTVNSELLYFLRHGKIGVKSGIARFEGKTVHFTDGSSKAYDVIISATGYHITFPFLAKSIVDFSDAIRVPLWLRIFHPEQQNLFFIGLIQPQGCIWPLADLQAKLCAKVLKGTIKLPQNLVELAEKDADKIEKQFLCEHRHAIEVHYHEYAKQLRRTLR